jgi:hydroxymethylbilane synthase
MKTQGDLLPAIPIEELRGSAAGKALFTDTLEKALVSGEIDLCVHSLKDMAAVQPEDAPIVAVAERADPRDVLVVPESLAREDTAFQNRARTESPALFLKKLGADLPVGCSGLRRRVQLLTLVPGLSIAPIRGNVPTRLAKLDSGQYGALILAAAGLARLGIARSGYVFSVEEMIPAAGQGALAVQGRRGEDYAFLEAVQDAACWEEVMAERAFIRALDCGCGSPAAAYARTSGNEMHIIGMYAADSNSPLFKGEITGDKREAARLAEELARRLARKAGLGQ